MRTPVLVAALVAALALGGSSGYAAGQLPKHSVGAKQLKKGAVKSKAVADGSLTAADFAPGVLPAPIGANTLTGAQIDESTLVAPPGRVVLTGDEFFPDGGVGYGSFVGRGRFLTATPNPVTAVVHLPPGSRMTGVTLTYTDVGGDDVSAVAGRVALATGAETKGAPAVSSGSVGGRRSMSVPVPSGGLGDDEAYYLTVFLPASSLYGVFGAVISYS